MKRSVACFLVLGWLIAATPPLRAEETRSPADNTPQCAKPPAAGTEESPAPPADLPEKAGPLSPEQLDSLISRVTALQERTIGFHARFENEKETILAFEPILSKGEIAVLKPGTFYKKVEGEEPIITFLHDDTLLIHFPNERRAERYHIKGEDAKVDMDLLMSCIACDLQKLRQRLEVSAEKEDTGLVRLDFVPGEDDDDVAEFFVKVSIWIDPDKPWPVSVRTENPDGDVSRDVYKNLRSFASEEDVPKEVKALFNYALPPRTKVTEPAAR